MDARARRLPALALLLAGCAGGDRPPRADDRPNVLVVTLDTTRADALSPFGGPPDATPNVQRLADEGARFTSAWTVTPLTIPAHSSLFTGVLPPRHGVRDNGDAFLSDAVTTLAERMREAGYATMAAVGAEVTSHHWGFAQGFDAFFDDLGPRTERNRWRVERRADAVLADAAGWLGERGPDAPPFFAWVHFYDAHHPYRAPEEWARRYPKRPYLAEVAWTDHVLGQLLEAVDTDRTWVFVLGDHGEALGEHGEAMHGMLLYQGTVRIPLVVRPPGGLPEPVEVDAPVSIVDVLPTVLEAAGLEPPADIDGRSLLPAIRGEGLPTDRPVYAESLYGWKHFGFAPQRAVLDGRYVLVDNRLPELYTADDRRQREDLAPVRPHEVARLQHLLDTWDMPPLEGASERADLDPERIAQLQALGYVAAGDAPDPDEEVPFRSDLPDPTEAQLFLRDLGTARAAIQAGDPDTAIARLAELSRRHPELVAPRRILAAAHRARAAALPPDAAREELGRALDLLAGIYREHPTPDVAAELAVTHMARGEPDAARPLLEEAVERDPYAAGAWIPLLHLHLLSGDLDGFAEAAAEARRRLPDTPSIGGLYGLSLLLRGDAAAGEPLVRAALEADPRQPFLHYGLCVLHLQRGELEEAERACLAELEVDPTAAPPRRALAGLYAQQRRYAAQLEQLRALADLEPPNPATAHATAQALFNLRRYDEALEAARSCAALDPAFPWCRLVEANALAKLGRREEGRRVFAEAQRLMREWSARAPAPGAAPGGPSPLPGPAPAAAAPR